jgi:UDP-N-acetylmuramate--alanine ligase
VKLKPGQHIFLVGIGGSGLSAIARVLLGQGYTVSGSDRSLNSLTEALARDGATIYQGHDAAQIAGADALIITSAVKDDHVEVAAARTAGIPVYKRQDIMADLMEGKTVIAVAGTKGKTTTTSMIVHILRECGQDPSYIVGGIMGNTGTNAGVGKGSAFVVEADEYDNMFLGLKPDIAVITNIEWDHPDFFKTPEDMVDSFRRFSLKVGKILLLCGDDAHCRQLADELDSKVLVQTYGKTNSDFWVENVSYSSNGHSVFELVQRGIRFSDQKVVLIRKVVKLPLPGLHNILNAVAALVAALNLNAQAIEALETFKPTARRFDVRADVKGIAIVDDYAHNPMSIKAVIEAAKQRYPDRAVWAVWQPHTYSRTQALFDQFVKAFDEANHVLVTDIYAAREAPVEGVNSAAVVAAMKRYYAWLSPTFARHTPTFADAVKVLHDEVKSPSVVVIMSAGDAPEIGVQYLKLLQETNV